MGVEWSERNKLLAEDNKIYLGMIVLILFLFFILILRIEMRGSLPSCQEDEYLYPEDYTGPGDNVPGDYKCVHVDTIRSK